MCGIIGLILQSYREGGLFYSRQASERILVALVDFFKLNDFFFNLHLYNSLGVKLIKFSTPIKIQSKGRCVQMITNERQ